VFRERQGEARRGSVEAKREIPGYTLSKAREQSNIPRECRIDHGIKI
jgi:hypothetical protein